MIKKFITLTRARYAETDAAEVLYYGSYFIYFEVGRIDMFRKLGIPYRRDLTIAQAHCNYLSPGKFDDLLEIHTNVVEVMEKGVKINSEVYRKNPDNSLKLLAKGYVTMLYVGQNHRASPLPKKYRAILERREIE